ncbi:MAG TPA: peptidoglycan DD-metalloendopeptidase family protein [Coriobacteriia bacterium]|nr:peptidoglycan DD-metalloendopeptidase family protein [Coriobacteriia bacterium]
MVAGAAVESPVDGTVRFVGRIPTADGDTMLCATIDGDSGTVTLMPLQSAVVHKGDSVDAGEAVGTLAAQGDSSSAAAHLHVGLKKGDVYVDPSPLLTAAAPAPQTPTPDPATAEPAPSARPSTQPVPAGTPLPVAKPAPSTATGMESAPKTAGSSTDAGQVTVPLGTAPAQAVSQLPAGVSLAADSATAPQIQVTDARPSPIAGVGSAIMKSVNPVGAWSPAPGHLGIAIGVVAALLAGSALLLTRRALTRRVTGRGPVSDRFGTLLQHLKAGDTICGLTSCSGPLPSQSRGR